MISVVIINDSELLKKGLRTTITAEADMEVIGDFTPDSTTIKSVKNLAPDLTFISIGSSTTDASTICSHIIMELPSTKVLIHSSTEIEEESLTFMMAGATGYLHANASEAELISAIRVVANGGFHFDTDMTELAISRLRQTGESYDPTKLKDLTEREMLILTMIGAGHTNDEISQALSIAIGTVRNNITRIRKKLDIHYRPQLVRFAVEQGLKYEPGKTFTKS